MRADFSIRRWYLLLIFGLTMSSVSCGYFVKTRFLEDRSPAAIEQASTSADVEAEKTEENPPAKAAAPVREDENASASDSGFVKHVLRGKDPAPPEHELVAENEPPTEEPRRKKKPAAERPAPPASIARPSEAPEALAKPSAVAAVASETPSRKVGMTLFLGVGINYVSYTENLDDLDTTYRDFRAPSTFMGIRMEATDRTSVEVSHKVTPIQFDNSSVGLNGIKADWQILALHGLTKADVFVRTDGQGNRVSEFQWLYGFQFHEMPLALFKNGTNEPVLKNIHLLNASLGASYFYYTNPWTRASILGHLQLPLSSAPVSGGASLQVRPVLLFDGSIGLEKKITAPLWVGVHWYGQYQRLNFDYSDGDTTASGTHSVLFSNMELRFTYDF